YYTELPFCQHSGKLTLAGIDCKFLLVVIPEESYSRIDSLLIVVIIPLIFIQHKLCICTFIYPDLKFIPWLFFSILHLRTNRNDASGFNIKGDLINGCLNGNFPTAFKYHIAIIVIPISTCRQVYVVTLCSCKVHVDVFCIKLTPNPVPSFFCLGIVNILRCILSIDDRSNKNRTTKHILVRKIPDFLVMGEVHGKSSHK